MTAPGVADPAGMLGEALSHASPDLMRRLLQTMVTALLPADADRLDGLPATRGSCSKEVGLRVRKADPAARPPQTLPDLVRPSQKLGALSGTSGPRVVW